MNPLIQFIEKAVPVALDMHRDGKTIEQIMLDFAPDFAMVMQRERSENEAKNKAAFIASLASHLLGPALETTESPEEARSLAERSVWLAGALVSEAEKYVRLQPKTG